MPLTRDVSGQKCRFTATGSQKTFPQVRKVQKPEMSAQKKPLSRQKPRVRIGMNTRTEAFKDSREKRQPQRDARELRDELDDLLDDIDSILEENATEFVSQYIQKSGE